MTQHIATIPEYLSRSAAGLADSVLEPCPLCGRAHPVPFKAILAAPGAIEQVPTLAERLLGRAPLAPLVIYDAAIADKIENWALRTLSAVWKNVRPFPMRGEPGHLLDSGVVNGSAAAEEIRLFKPDLLVAAGSGVICDLTKWIATRLGLPFILCGTAPSMNGYTSITATMTEGDVKISHYLNPADAVVLDVDMLAGAPVDMIRSGLGDLSARAVCNADWKLSNLLHGTYFCSLPYQMTAENEARTLAHTAGLVRGKPDAMAHMAETVLTSGLSMTVLQGETSPSSGAEHVISHFFDLLVHLRGVPKNFHGTQVGVGTVIMLHAYQLLRQLNPARIDPRRLLRTRRSLEEIEADARARFGAAAEGFMTVARQKRIPDDQYVAYVRAVQSRWDEIWASLEMYAAPPERITGPFRAAGVPMTLEAIHRTREEGREALLFGNIYRPRYTLLDLLWELGLFPGMADEILDQAGV